MLHPLPLPLPLPKNVSVSFDRNPLEIVGFKEIRHQKSSQLDFFTRLFPCAKFILNWREDIAAQSKSAWYGELNQDEAERVLRRKTTGLQTWGHDNAARSFSLVLGEYGFQVQQFNSLLEWLGIHGCRL